MVQESDPPFTLWHVGSQQLHLTFDGGCLISDAGLRAVRALEKPLRVIADRAQRLPDPRSPSTSNPPPRPSSLWNPLPEKPGVVPDSEYPRSNGSICIEQARPVEQRRFEELLIPRAGQATLPMAFLMGAATRKGAGLGKRPS